MNKSFNLVEVSEMNPGEQPENLNVEQQGKSYEDDEEPEEGECIVKGHFVSGWFLGLVRIKKYLSIYENIILNNEK